MLMCQWCSSATHK